MTMYIDVGVEMTSYLLKFEMKVERGQRICSVEMVEAGCLSLFLP